MTLGQIAQLKDNWNEKGASAFAPEHIKLCEDIIRDLSAFELQVFPTGCGTIQLEFGNSLEFEVSADGRIEGCYI
jgi:hypothetical protein